MGATERTDGAPRILMKRTGSSKPLDRPATPGLEDNGLLILDGPRALRPWVEQTKRMAVELNCLDALQTRENIPRGTLPRTESEWLRKAHTEAAQHIVLSRITPAVFAYMRVLGYNSICGENAAETYHYAQLAAGRMHIPHYHGREPRGHSQRASAEEVDRMLWEWQFSSRDSYPGQISYDQAMMWLGKMLRRRAQTDEKVREILETLERQDRESRDSVPSDKPGVPETQRGKRKSRHEETESASFSNSSYQSHGTQMKTPRATVTAPLEDSEPFALEKERRQLQVSVADSEVDKSPGLIAHLIMPHQLPQQPDKQTTRLKYLPQLDMQAIASPAQAPETGLLTPRDMKTEPPDF